MKALALTGIAIFVMAVLALSSDATPQYVQTSCDIDDNNYAAIDLMRVSDVGKPTPHKYNIDFQQRGIVVRLPPEYFGEDWSDTRAEVVYQNNRSEKGSLTLYVRESDGSTRPIPIATIQKSCWRAVRSYIRRRVESRGVTVQIQETVKDPR